MSAAGPEEQATINDEQGTVASQSTRNGEVIGYRRDDLEINPPTSIRTTSRPRRARRGSRLCRCPTTLSESPARLRHADRRVGLRPHPPARRRAAGRADHRPRPPTRRRRPPGSELADRDLAGERRGPLPPRKATSTRRRSTPTSRWRALHDRRPRPLRVHRRSSPAPIRGRITRTRGARAHIHFSLFGPRVRDAAGDADVLPRATRCSSRTRSSTRSPTSRPRTDDLPLRPRPHRSRVGTGLRIRHRSPWPRGHPDGGLEAPALTPSQTIGPFLHIELPFEGEEARSPEPSRRDPPDRPGLRRRGATRSTTG